MLLLARSRRHSKLFKAATAPSFARYQSSYPKSPHDPLNILFCGSDQFSIYSLETLRKYQNESPNRIADIQVLCRPDKPVGRGLKQTQEVPIKRIANELGLRLHQIDTFRDWLPPPSINLIVAVSFGLLVPARILEGAKYGGLNVHPSLLPDLRGPAPIVHTLLKQRPETGVTLQTMHPTRFDHGTILSQTPRVEVPPECTPDELLHKLGPLGADLLCGGIDDGLFVPPLQEIRSHEMTELTTSDYAPKINPEDRHIDWKTWTSKSILLRDRVLGRLWDTQTHSRCLCSTGRKRMTFSGPWTVFDKADAQISTSTYPGEPLIVGGERSGSVKLGIGTVDGNIVMPSAATVEGQAKDKGLSTVIKILTKGKR